MSKSTREAPEISLIPESVRSVSPHQHKVTAMYVGVPPTGRVYILTDYRLSDTAYLDTISTPSKGTCVYIGTLLPKHREELLATKEGENGIFPNGAPFRRLTREEMKPYCKQEWAAVYLNAHSVDER